MKLLKIYKGDTEIHTSKIPIKIYKGDKLIYDKKEKIGNIKKYKNNKEIVDSSLI